MFPVLRRHRWENSARRLWYKFKLLARQNVKVDKNFFTSDAAMRLSAGVLPKGAKLFEAMLLAPKVAALPRPVSTTFAYPFAPHLPALARADAPPTPPPLA